MMAAGCFVALLFVVGPTAQSDRVVLDGLRKIAILNASSPTAHLNLAFNLGKVGLNEEALNSYRRALELQPELIPARFGEGNMLFGKGEYEKAARSYEEVLARQPDNRLARYNLGTAYLNRGLFELAARSYEELLRADPADARVHKNLGQALIGLQRPCDALVELERSTALDPQLAEDRVLHSQIRHLIPSCRSR